MIFVFLMPHSVEKLKSKFEKELRKGAKVISYVSNIKGWNPKEIVKDEKSPAAFIYEM